MLSRAGWASTRATLACAAPVPQQALRPTLARRAFAVGGKHIESATEGSAAAAGGTALEQHMSEILLASIEGCEVEVQDVSGGCGTSMSVSVTASADVFPLNKLKQHRMVTAALKEVIPEIHAIQINTVRRK